MNFTAKAPVSCERYHASVPVPDVVAAHQFYSEKLGFELGFTYGDPPTMAGVTLGEAQIFFRAGEAKPEGCALFFVVEDADALYEFHHSRGVTPLDEPADKEYGLRDYRLEDLNGYLLGFGHYIYTQGPKVAIERVEVPVRLEKRLAALLEDLAAHKGMSLTSCLEEILLHTCEPLGDGVASPHTKRTLDYIQELKRKHDIDYDCHASYRFVEE